MRRRAKGVLAAALAALLVAAALPGAAASRRPNAGGQARPPAGPGFSLHLDAGGGWPTLSHPTPDLPLEVYRGKTHDVFTLEFHAAAPPKADLEQTAVAWTAAYRLPEGGRAAVTVSRLTPAALIESTRPDVTLRAKAPPKYAAFVRGGKPIVVAAGKLAGLGAGGVALDEPWVLVWFGAATPVTGRPEPFDVETDLGVSKARLQEPAEPLDLPMMVRLEHRPSAIRADGRGGLTLVFPETVGRMALVPPMGGRIFLPAETEAWADGLPDAVVAQCRLWSATLRDVPRSVQASFAVDGAAGAVTVNQRFTWASLADDWNSPAVKAAPVPPILALALGARMPITFLRDGRPVEPTDLNLMDTPGRAMAVKGTDAYAYRIGGLAALVCPKRAVPKVAPGAAPLQRNLERHVAAMVQAGRLAPLLYIYGGIGGTWFSHFYWARSADLATALAEARPYLSTDLRARAVAYLKAEWAAFPALAFDRKRYRSGALRTPYDFPWDDMQRQLVFAMTREERRCKADFFADLYGVDAYLALTGDAPAADLRGRARGLAEDLSRQMDWAILGPKRMRDVRGRHELFYYNRQGSATYNRWLAGAIGLVRLSRRFGWQDEERTAWHLVARLAAARVAQARYVAEAHGMGLVRGRPEADNRAVLHIDATCTVLGRGPVETGVHENQELPPFYDLTEEVGRLLGRYARSGCRQYLDRMDRSVPLWYISEAPKQQATEHRTCPLQHTCGPVLAQYWVLDKRGPALVRYVDTTRFTGDLYYIRRLAAAIASYGGDGR